MSLGDNLSEEDVRRARSSECRISRQPGSRKGPARSLSVPAAETSRLRNMPTLAVFDEEDEVRGCSKHHFLSQP